MHNHNDQTLPYFFYLLLFTKYLLSVFSLQIFAFSFHSCCSFANVVFSCLKSIIFFLCSLENSQNFFIQSLLLCTMLVFYAFKWCIAEIEKPDGICSSTPQTQYIDWTYIRRAGDVQVVFWKFMYVQFTSCVYGVLTFVVNEFSGLFLHLSIFYDKHSRSE